MKLHGSQPSKQVPVLPMLRPQHDWRRLKQAKAWVGCLTQRGSRLNKPVLAVLAHLNKLWAVLAM